jgi:hypothetical protein
MHPPLLGFNLGRIQTKKRATGVINNVKSTKGKTQKTA